MRHLAATPSAVGAPSGSNHRSAERLDRELRARAATGEPADAGPVRRIVVAGARGEAIAIAPITRRRRRARAPALLRPRDDRAVRRRRPGAPREDLRRHLNSPAARTTR